MKKLLSVFRATGVLLCLASCDFQLEKQESQKTSLSLRFCDTPTQCKSYDEIPDTSEFLVTITDSGGNSVFSGRYYDVPRELEVPPGDYTVSAQSCKFSEPLFDSPQYGCTVAVTVKKGEHSCAVLDCAQENGGIRLIFDPAFRSEYPSAQIFIASAQGRLFYGYNEKRTGYFLPGTVELKLFEANDGKSLVSYRIKAGEMLTLKVLSSESAVRSQGVEFTLDTARTWTSQTVIDSGGWSSGGGSETEIQTIDVSKASSHIGEKGVWIEGYIAGLSKSTSSSEFSPPFSSNTNLLLASSKGETDREKCIAVELKKGEIRDLLNLKDHPGYLGRKVRLKGDVVESYFSLTGLKNISSHEWE